MYTLHTNTYLSMLDGGFLEPRVFYRMQATRQTPRIGEKVARWGWKGKRSARKRANGERIESRTITESIMDGNGRTVEWKGMVFGNCICFDLSAV